MDISNQIKTRREAMGLSQEQLAEKLYVSRQTISNWERTRRIRTSRVCSC